jgi:hypothetical protein
MRFSKSVIYSMIFAVDGTPTEPDTPIFPYAPKRRCLLDLCAMSVRSVASLVKQRLQGF